MRLQSVHGELRITFEGESQERFAAVWSACIYDQFCYPPELHDLRPYGCEIMDRYISVGLCNDREVLWRIRRLMEQFERDFGLVVDDDVRKRMAGWSEPVRLVFASRTQERKIKPAGADIPDRCVGCRYRYMNNGTDCKLFLMMGDMACGQ